DNLDKWVLGVLHEEEEARRLHTVTVTPLPYEHLKKRWKAQNHFFSNSDYGSARHKMFAAQSTRFEDLLRLAETLGIPDWMTDYAQRVTGGYPETLGAVLEWWDKTGRPSHRTPPIQREMLRHACDQLGGFVEWLDPLEDGRYRDHVIDLY